MHATWELREKQKKKKLGIEFGFQNNQGGGREAMYVPTAMWQETAVKNDTGGLGSNPNAVCPEELRPHGKVL